MTLSSYIILYSFIFVLLAKYFLFFLCISFFEFWSLFIYLLTIKLMQSIIIFGMNGMYETKLLCSDRKRNEIRRININ